MQEIVFTLIIYIMGEVAAFYNIRKWAGYQGMTSEEAENCFAMSLLSWGVFPLYLVCHIIYKMKGK